MIAKPYPKNAEKINETLHLSRQISATNKSVEIVEVVNDEGAEEDEKTYSLITPRPISIGTKLTGKQMKRPIIYVERDGSCIR